MTAKRWQKIVIFVMLMGLIALLYYISQYFDYDVGLLILACIFGWKVDSIADWLVERC